ncbi:conserved exported hypothetical protein [Nitrosotalea sinensis]|uniref:Uncharacterized protein n=1 Tax=Nitrosotalea sinensis TaxID=1499975 RepID=A0A2H1EE92_9ARCH|nr:hypothetical protein [Candidatus Nitrosotalea sinensis]SHO42775.1 conserved exported hypothetical protein [Candidatus Nitrosotalea sinensis]
MKSTAIMVFLILGVSLLPAPNYASAHNNLNSDDQTIGNYEVQVATDPEIPDANQPFKLSFRVLNHESASNIFNSLNTQVSEVSNFRMGARIYYNDQLVGTIPVQSFDKGEWSTYYTFHETGNHVVDVDLYDVGPNGKTLTFTYNITVLNIFGNLFPYIISSGGIAFVVIVAWALITRRKIKPKH